MEDFVREIDVDKTLNSFEWFIEKQVSCENTKTFLYNLFSAFEVAKSFKDWNESMIKNYIERSEPAVTYGNIEEFVDKLLKDKAVSSFDILLRFSLAAQHKHVLEALLHKNNIKIPMNSKEADEALGEGYLKTYSQAFKD